jgi:hypothetical protein
MKKLILVILCCSLAAGCAAVQETPQSIAAKTLLTSRQAVIAGATTVDALCKQNIVKPADCVTAATLYKQSQAAYNVASDAFVLSIQTANAADWTEYLKAESSFTVLAQSTIVACQAFSGGAK